MIKDKKRIIFKNNIEHLRREAGITVDELANRAGISRTYAQEIKAGIKAPSHITQEKIAKALNTTVSALTSTTNNNLPKSINRTLFLECKEFTKLAVEKFKVDIEASQHWDVITKVYNLIVDLSEKEGKTVHPTIELAYAVLMQQ